MRLEIRRTKKGNRADIKSVESLREDGQMTENARGNKSRGEIHGDETWHSEKESPNPLFALIPGKVQRIFL